GGIGGQGDGPNICRPFGGAAGAGGVVYLPRPDGGRAGGVGDAGKPHVLWRAAGASTRAPAGGGGPGWGAGPHRGAVHRRGAVAVGKANRFATPAISGSQLVVGTLTGIAVVATS